MTFRIVYTALIPDQGVRKVFLRGLHLEKISCRNCSSDQIFWMNEREYRCRSCWHTGSITTGTWLERSKIPLRLWYELVWCFAVTHAAHKAGKLLGVSPKTCWLVYQTIRKALVSSSLRDHHQLSGTLEVDESFYGGLFKNLRKNIRFKLRKEGLAKRGRGAVYRKQPVFGIYKRNGTVYLDLVAECSKKELETIIKKKIEINSEVFSDTFKSYNGLVGLGYVHSTVDHGMEIYVDGRVHVNGMEGFWGLSKTNMHTYKGIRKANWIYYLKEMEFRYNNRQMNFDKLVLKIIGILMSHREESFVPY